MKRLILLGLVCGAIAAEVACGGDDSTTTIYVVPDGGGGVSEGGTFCEPANTPAPAFGPSAVNQAKCNDAQIKQLLDACTFNGSPQLCATAKQQLGDCATCMIGAESDPTTHPLYQYDPNSGALVSQGACMVAVAQSDNAKACGVAFGQVETCSFASCVTACFDDPDDTHFDACVRASVGSTCTTGVDAFNSDSCGTLYTDMTTYGFCTSGKNTNGTDMTNLEFFTAIAKLYCGGGATTDEDAGIKDAGQDG